MKRNLLFLAVMALAVFSLSTVSMAVCPQAPNDNGNCDTLFLEVWPEDTVLLAPGPSLVRVLFYVYHDLTIPVDSIAAFVIPLCLSHTNPSKYCSITGFNNTNSLTILEPNRSVFRDIEGVENWMLDLYQEDTTLAWDIRTIRAASWANHFHAVLIGDGDPDRAYGEDGLTRLLLTMTLKLEDSMTVCIDTCFWPPSTRIVFSRSDAKTYIPRMWEDYLGQEQYCFRTVLFLRGDATGDGVIDVGDVVYVINYLFKAGDPPIPLRLGDANCDEIVSIDDVVYLVNYLFRHGPAPACE